MQRRRQNACFKFTLSRVTLLRCSEALCLRFLRQLAAAAAREQKRLRALEAQLDKFVTCGQLQEGCMPIPLLAEHGLPPEDLQ